MLVRLSATEYAEGGYSTEDIIALARAPEAAGVVATDPSGGTNERPSRRAIASSRKVVADGKVTTLDHGGASERLAEAQAKMMKLTPGRDYRGRTTDEIAPLTLPLR